jgi:hypothetical protein
LTGKQEAIMQDPISRRRFLGRVGAVGAVAGTAVAASTLKAQPQLAGAWPDDDEWLDGLESGLADSIHWAPSPDPRHLKRRGRGWNVLPTGRDDHDNIEWALRNTAAGGIVKLAPGIFKVGGPIIVPNFNGALVGSGTARTTMTCTDEFSYEVWEAPGGGKDRGEPLPPPFPRLPVDGSATKSPPVLISFYKTPLGRAQFQLPHDIRSHQGSGRGRQGNRLRRPELIPEGANSGVVGAEVVPPLADTVRFVHRQ